MQQVKLQINNRKKQFGIEYIDLVEKNASEEALETCVDRAMEDISVLREKMKQLQGTIDQNKQALERKISGRAGSLNQNNYSGNNSSFQQQRTTHPSSTPAWSSVGAPPGMGNPPPSAPFESNVY